MDRIMNGIKISLIAALCVVNSYAEVINLESVSVTGLKEEEKVVDQALSISTKDQKEIELDQVIFQKDLLNSMAGVRIEQTTSTIGHKTSIRMPSTTGPYYLFLQDDIPVQSSGFFNHNGLAYTTFETANSAEVLKGAGTALYGSDAMAAVVNIKSAQEPSKERESRIRIKGGSYGYASGMVESSDTLDDKNAYRAKVGYSRSDGWRNQTEYDRVEGTLRYDYLVNDENAFKFVLTGSKTDAEQADSFSDFSFIENGSKAASDDPNYFKALATTDIKRKFDYARLSAEWNNYSVDDLEISVTPYLRYNRNRYVATWEKNLPSNDSTQRTFGLMQKNSLDQSWGHIIFGFDTEYTQADTEYNQDVEITTSGWGAKTYSVGPLYNYDVTYFAVAPYLHTDVSLSEELVLSAGLRYDYNHYDYENKLTVGADASDTYYRAADRTDSFDHLSPKVALSYRPMEDLNIYARYANGFRIPQASRLYSQKVGYESVNLDSETSDTYEIGVKKEFENSYLEVSTYYMVIDDTITRYTNVSNGLYYYDNGGKTNHKGVEITAFSQLTQDWGVKGAYSYSKHKFDNDPVYGNNQQAEAPNTTANGRVIYTPNYVKGLSLMAEWQYVGKYYMDDANTKEYNGYSIGHFKADYRYNKALSVFGKVTNITDKQYATAASLRYGNNYTPGDPRQFYAGLEYRW